MTEQTQLRHGGRLAEALRAFGGQREDWLDLSTGISPVAYPFSEPPVASYTRLPDLDDDQRLSDAARRAYRMPPTSSIVATPGTQALIQLLPRLQPQGKAAVDVLGYQEHARCWRLAGHDVVEQANPLEAVRSDETIRYATIIHPHNPCGHFYDEAAVRAAADTLAKRGGMLVIDEAFCDAAPSRSFAADLPFGAMVLRSFGKFYGLAGIRVGFAVGQASLVAELAVQLGPWAVPGPAINIAAEALSDAKWSAHHALQLETLSAQLSDLLAAAGFAAVGSTELFVSVRHGDARRIEQALAEKHILVRGFDQDETLLRFGLPASDQEFERLERALSDIIR